MIHTHILKTTVSELHPIIKCGIDEVGRGCLAGPVTAAAVVLPHSPLPQLEDSKKLTEKQRHLLKYALYKLGTYWGIGWASPKEIDKINIHHASLLAMQRAYSALLYTLSKKTKPFPHIAYIDGKYAPQLPITCRNFIAGDTYIPAIQAASIIAKITRDRFMKAIDILFPVYGFLQNKGYPTPRHRRALYQHGHCEIHRLSFHLYDVSS